MERSTEISAAIPGLGVIAPEADCLPLTKNSDGAFEVGKSGVVSILATGDHKVEFIVFENHTLAFVKSAMGYPAYYPVHPVQIQKPLRGAWMDWEGTTVHSEGFGIGIIQMSLASLLVDRHF